MCCHPCGSRVPALPSALTPSWQFPLALTVYGVYFSFHSSAPFSFYITLAPVSGSFVGTWEGDQHTFPPQKTKVFPELATVMHPFK